MTERSKSILWGDIMFVNEVGNSGTTEVVESINNGNIGKQDFLLLLVEELKHQDPANPLNNQEFMAQLAQFQQMEAMQNLSSGMEDLLANNNMSRGASMVGRIVTGLDKYTGEAVRGFVSKVSMTGDEVILTVEEYDAQGNFLDDYDVPMDTVSEIEI